MYCYYPFFGLGWNFAGLMVSILFWVFIILGIVHLFKCSKKKKGPCASKGEETPLDILKRRYAAGEINAEEFAQKKKDLAS